MSEAYKAAGVDLELGDEFSGMLFEASKQTWANRAGKFGEPTASHDSFSALRSISLQPLLEVPQPEGIRLHMGDDGVGTKVEVAERIADHSTVAFDLLAMVCDDAAVKGYEPAAVTTTLDVQKLDPSMRPEMTELATGYVKAAHAGRVALVNGEVAELGGYGDGLKYNWSATILAPGHEDRLLDGSRVQSGDTLIGFLEGGFRSNGLRLVRKTLEARHGPDWHNAIAIDDITFGELVMQPSSIYSPVLVDAIGGYDLRQEPKVEVHAAAHITGGGVPGKLGRMLEITGLGAEISEPNKPSITMRYVQKLAGITDEEAYRVWNMGQGMIVATPEPYKLIRLARDHNVPAGRVGVVTPKPGITIRSEGLSPGEKLTFPAK